MSEKKETEVENESDKLWEEIKKIPLNIFGSLNQTIESCTERVKVNSKDVHLKSKFSAVIIGLEEILLKDQYGTPYNPPKFEILQEDPFVVVKKLKLGRKK